MVKQNDVLCKIHEHNVGKNKHSHSLIVWVQYILKTCVIRIHYYVS